MKLSTCKILLFTILVFGVANWGCYYSTTLPAKATAKIDSTDEVFKVETISGRTIRFDCEGCVMARLWDTTIIGVSSHRAVERIPLSDVQNLHVRRVSIPLTIVGAGVTASAFLLGLFLFAYLGPG